MTQAGLGRTVGVVQSSISQAERGEGGTLSLDFWQRIFVALGRRLVVEAGRDSLEEPRDAGHLRIQELVLRLGRSSGYQASFEVPSRPADPVRSVDVMLRDDRRRLLVVVEAWNTIGDIGAAVRSFQRKLTEAEALAIAIGGQRPHRVCGLWVVRAAERNRRLLASLSGALRRALPCVLGRMGQLPHRRLGPADRGGPRLVRCLGHPRVSLASSQQRWLRAAALAASRSNRVPGDAPPYLATGRCSNGGLLTKRK
jgi:hypothetical protein